MTRFRVETAALGVFQHLAKLPKPTQPVLEQQPLSERAAAKLKAKLGSELASERSDLSAGLTSGTVQSEPRDIASREAIPPARIAPPIRQIAEAITGAEDGRVELQLEPEELGRVSFNMKHSEQGVSLHITADRPETLELLRRHADQLVRYLQEHGYQSSSFSFAGGRSGRQPAPGKLRGAGQPHPSAEVTTAATQAPRSGKRQSNGMDLRL
ncbi:flagellar hook-length control protein FliK [Salipiger sp. PrR002]|uniref:flagellar hook-length control protein FliK n=1 Tax=Salipiger sp. PrR002 TaxID=2706489 RepID=UPI0013BC6341|nr:flagellar hook-length control protein FliK [Salipiger sp. PrR002]NDV98170.1 hypothetical protein [Salipiger sp. PrR002]NDW54882.1 hypothetical protein [Salipiger sp. PrR004]